jgi:hypothetical protein
MDRQETEEMLRCIAYIKNREVSDKVCYSAAELLNVTVQAVACVK